jgi:NAD(P)H-dependent flavin oxidoreductase YrpB (nitropropane dioxygenase family)
MSDVDPTTLPAVIQGGMGVAVSSWHLAREVSQAGGLGVVSGTALDQVLARRLQDGDPGGHSRRALAHFPVPEIAERVLARHYRPGGRPPGTPYAPAARLAVRPTRASQELAVAGNFVEVWLAKEGHDGPVGINFLEKIQMATPAAAYGALLAGVDAVLMGAGVPREMPRLLNALARHEQVGIPLDVAGAPEGTYTADVDPRELLGIELPRLRRPAFLAIVSAHVLAAYLARDAGIRPDGFVVEGPTAGGHNAPPRGRLTLDEVGQPVYGPRDLVDSDKMAALGLPFWLAGSAGTPDQVLAAQLAGARGVQVGTLFALSLDSGLLPDLRGRLLAGLADGSLDVRTDKDASPTGFPFKVAQLAGTQSDDDVYQERPRLCDLGYLRTPFVRDNGAIGYRCAAEPVHTFLRKGGDEADTVGRKCLCNALMANVGLGQTRADGYAEVALVTMGADLAGARRLQQQHPAGWTARQAVAWLLSDVDALSPVPVAG